jgi:hypothetical protein
MAKVAVQRKRTLLDTQDEVNAKAEARDCITGCFYCKQLKFTLILTLRTFSQE